MAAPTTHMKAITQDRYGKPDVLEYAEIPLPEPTDDHILIKVKASSVNAADWHMSTGTPWFIRLMIGFRRPKTPVAGSDVAGDVVSVGSNVTRYQVGDRVFGDVGGGTWAEYALGRETTTALLPDGVSYEQGGAAGIAGLTAIQGLRDHGQVEPGQSVLIIGASGGVGTFAVPIAKALGAEVTAVCSTRNVEQAKQLGADEVIDYKTTPYLDVEEVYDVVFDNVGLDKLSRLKKVLNPGGKLVSITGPKGKLLGPLPRMLRAMLYFRFTDRDLLSFTANSNHEDLAELGEMMASGAIKPAIENRYDLADSAAALAYLGEGHSRGKGVILVS